MVLSNIEFVKADIRFNDSFSLIDINWKLEPGQVWAIMGSSGSGKSALAAALTGAGDITSGSVKGIVTNAGVVSLESQAALIERERLRDDSDLTDKINDGTPVREMLNEVSIDPELLTKLITGDHPQCYVNDIFVCGYQRGNGESIWDIKHHIGYVSSTLQWDYRVSISAINVIISGFYDSIGLYSRATDLQKEIAMSWLQILGFEDQSTRPFNQFSYGDQRLLLICRAMVKHPHLMILDEPCFGLDDMNRQLVLALIERICTGSETTVIYVNHHAQDQIEGIENYLALGLT